MKASEVKFQELLNGNRQYCVPLFQRTYSWTEENWERLWDDILEIYQLPSPRSHFIGAIVTLLMPDAPERTTKYMLIDGQQRLTTLLVLLAAVRDLARQRGDTTTAAQIEDECLINRYATLPDEREKFRPTQLDVAAFQTVIKGKEPTATDRISAAYRFFRNALAKGDLDRKAFNVTTLRSCITAYLDLVSIHLDQGDSPHRIFESLNNTGMALGAADLVRNHIFMQISSETDQAAAYQRYWLPMQSRLEYEGGKSALSDFFWRYLMMDGSSPRYDEVFEMMRLRIEKAMRQTTMTHVLSELDRYSSYYARIWRPKQHEPSPALRDRLERLNQWEMDVAYPFVLTALHHHASESITDDDLLQVLGLVESYVIRRAICGQPTNRLRRVFAVMPTKVTTKGYVASCRRYLMDNEWPTDDEFTSALVTARVYVQSRVPRARLLLTSLERSFAHREAIEISPTITIEHIMPQSLSAAWRADLGPKAIEIHERYLHTIGNLTLSGYNADLGNEAFAVKREMLRRSNFELNKEIATADRWTEEQIVTRAHSLAKRAVKIWTR